MTSETEIRDMADASVPPPYVRALGIQGTSQDDATMFLFDMARPGKFKRIPLPAGETVLTQAIMGSGLLCSTAADNTTVTIPTFADLGFAPSGEDEDIAFQVQRTGLGSIFVNPADADVVSIDFTTNDLDPQFLPPGHSPVLIITNWRKGLNEWVAV